jgi:hypothetical protein
VLSSWAIRAAHFRAPRQNLSERVVVGSVLHGGLTKRPRREDADDDIEAIALTLD